MVAVKNMLVAATLTAVTLTASAAGRVFYDGFESGNTNLWLTPGDSNRCQVVTSSVDGVSGPYAGSRMARCNENGAVEWNDPARTENLSLNTSNRTNELFVRARMRVDSDHDRTSGSPKKVFRWFQWDGNIPTYCDYYTVIRGDSLGDEGLIAGNQFPTYWGGDSVADSGGWHTWEVYFNFATGTLRSWRDNVLTRNNTGLNMSVCAMSPWDLLSNWSDPHDASNHIYFDEVEVFSDNGTGGTGSMFDGTITQAGGTTPPPADTTPPVVSSPLPTGTLAAGTTSATLQVTTNEAATCRYGATDAAYASLPSVLGAANSTAHSTAISVSPGSYSYFVRCQDAAGNANTSSTRITFSVASPTAAAPASAAVPRVSGTVAVGSTLSATKGSWSNSPTSYTYQWQRGTSAISGATAATYVIAAADVGSTIRVAVTASNAAGSATALSAATAAVPADRSVTSCTAAEATATPYPCDLIGILKTRGFLQ